MEYDPHNASHRRKLASMLQEQLGESGFELNSDAPGWEETYERRHTKASRVVVRVYSSVVDGEVRGHGEDAIRVVAFDVEAQRPLRKAKRVFRTGTFEAIRGRMYQRMRDVWAGALADGYCRSCGAPRAVSKENKPYCIDRCWLKES